MNSKGFNAVMMTCLWIVLAFMYIPITAIIGMSFNATPYGMFPYVFTTDWYVTLFTDSNLLPACWYSLKFSFAVTLAAVVIGTMTSYGLQAYSPKWANRFNFVLQLPIIIPWLVAGGIMAMIMCFNNFVVQYYLIPIGVQTLPTLVFTRIRSGYQADLNALSAIIVLVSVVVVIALSKLGFSAGGLFGMSSGSNLKKGE